MFRDGDDGSELGAVVGLVNIGARDGNPIRWPLVGWSLGAIRFSRMDSMDTCSSKESESRLVVLSAACSVSMK